jgi:hypothetical protein
MIKSIAALGMGALLLMGCQDGMGFVGPPPTELSFERDAAGRCFVRDTSPAVISVVTQQQLVAPAVLGPNGEVIQPAIYRNVDQPEVQEIRDELLFEALCPERLTPDLVSTLQRALRARGHYRGQITGMMNNATRRAIRDYQRPLGHDSVALSIESARGLGIILVDLADPAG